MATNVQIPSMGESITEAVIARWLKGDGEQVAADEPICELETDKANFDLPAPASGLLRRAKEAGETVRIGETIGRIEESVQGKKESGRSESAGAPAKSSGPASEKAPAAKPTEPAAAEDLAADLSPAVRRLIDEHKLDPRSIHGSGRGGRITKEDVLAEVERKGTEASTERKGDEQKLTASPPQESTEPAEAKPIESPRTAPTAPTEVPPTAPEPKPGIGPLTFDEQGMRRVPMSKIRRRIAERLVRAQHTAAMLTTFNEVDMSALLELRNRYRERFEQVHRVPLGLMSFFARAAVLALKEHPVLNAEIDGDEIVYHEHVNLGIAVSTERGLVVPVLRNVEAMSFARIEAEIKRVAEATRQGKLKLEQLSGGTFTVTNGGVFGSLLSTPILNPPQTGILGMHKIEKRPVVVEDRIEIRPMMYLALTYDHRLVDGKESVTFLVRVKELIEDPARLMLEI